LLTGEPSPTDNLTVAVLPVEQGAPAPQTQALSWRARLLSLLKRAN
jgi:hypothetical protein